MSLRVEKLSIKRGSIQLMVDAAFAINRGEIVGIVGESGTGKTALLRAILGLEPDSRGVVRAFGANVSLPTSPMGAEILAVRSFLGVHFGSESLRPYETVRGRVHRLAGDNVRGSKAKTMSNSLVERLGLSGKLDRYPHELSMGQKARAGILACLASDRPIILLDEFGSNLDRRTQQSLFAAAKATAELGRALGIVSHARDLLQTIATTIYEIKDQRLDRV